MQHIAAKYERARAHAHHQFYYSMRDQWAREELDRALEFIDYLHARELREYKTRRDAINARRRELHR